MVLGLAGRERQQRSWELQGGQELLFFCSCTPPHHGYGALAGRPASAWWKGSPLWFDQISWLDLFGSGTAAVLLHTFVGFWVIRFCIEMEWAHVVCLLKGALTNENKSRNTSWSVPKLSLVLGGLSLPLPDSVPQVDYLSLCSTQENLVSAIFRNFESLYGKGLSPLPCPVKLCRQALVGWPLCWLSGCRSWGDSELCWSWV